jgi:hypothetical protein
MKGQVTIELFMVLALVIATIVFIVAIESESVQTSVELVREAQGRVVAKEIAQTLDYMFIQGPGAQGELEIEFPPNFNPSKSYVGSASGPGNIVNLHLDYPEGGIDVQERTAGRAYGLLPNKSGKNTLRIRMLNDVAVVNTPRLLTSPAEIRVVAEPRENRTQYATIMYNGETSKSAYVYIEGSIKDWITPIQKYGGVVDVDLFKMGAAGGATIYRGLTLVPGMDAVIGIRIEPPRFAEPGLYNLSLRIESQDGVDKIRMPLNIEILRKFEWIRINPPEWPPTVWEYGKDPGYDLSGWPIYAKFVLCNEHTLKKNIEVLVDYDRDVFNLVPSTPPAPPNPCGCVNGRWFTFDYESDGGVFTLFNNSSVLPQACSPNIPGGCPRSNFRIFNPGECAGFQIDISMIGGGAGALAVTNLFKQANNVSSYPINSSNHNISAIKTSLEVPILINLYGRSGTISSTRVELEGEALMKLTFACNVSVAPGNVTVVDC